MNLKIKCVTRLIARFTNQNIFIHNPWSILSKTQRKSSKKFIVIKPMGFWIYFLNLHVKLRLGICNKS